MSEDGWTAEPGQVLPGLRDLLDADATWLSEDEQAAVRAALPDVLAC